MRLRCSAKVRNFLLPRVSGQKSSTLSMFCTYNIEPSMQGKHHIPRTSMVSLDRGQRVDLLLSYEWAQRDRDIEPCGFALWSQRVGPVFATGSISCSFQLWRNEPSPKVVLGINLVDSPRVPANVATVGTSDRAPCQPQHHESCGIKVEIQS